MQVTDIETSGLDSSLCSILSLGSVSLEHPDKRFYLECRIFPGAKVEQRL